MVTTTTDGRTIFVPLDEGDQTLSTGTEIPADTTTNMTTSTTTTTTVRGNEEEEKTKE